MTGPFGAGATRAVAQTKPLQASSGKHARSEPAPPCRGCPSRGSVTTT